MRESRPYGSVRGARGNSRPYRYRLDRSNPALRQAPDLQLANPLSCLPCEGQRMHFDRLKRRDFITLIGGAAAWPLATWAQLGSARHIGVLMNGAATEVAPQSYVATFVQTLRQLGWIEGQNVRVDVRWSAGDAALARIYAAQLIGLTPDVILASSTTNLTAIQQGTSTVPVVFVQVSDPVEQGFVANLTRPGGHLTGFPEKCDGHHRKVFSLEKTPWSERYWRRINACNACCPAIRKDSPDRVTGANTQG